MHNRFITSPCHVLQLLQGFPCTLAKRFASVSAQARNSMHRKKAPIRSSKSNLANADALFHAIDFLSIELRWIRLFLSTIISSRRNNVGALLSANHAGDKVLDNAASYLLQSPGKLIRPALVLLMSYCSLPSCNAVAKIKRGIEEDVRRMEQASLQSHTPKIRTRSLSDAYAYPQLPHGFQNILVLASVTELMHVASLLHDDVIDCAAFRRGKPTLASVSGAKVSILAGDFLFSRACGLATTLGSMPVVSLISSALEELVRGELLQMGSITDEATYYEKNHRKTGSLLEKSLASSMYLIQRSVRSADPKRAGKIGTHMGQAFQIIDDCLDFVGDEAVTGKPRFSDLKDAIFTLPVLLAAKKDSSLRPLLSQPMNERAVRHIIESVAANGTIQHSKRIAHQELDKAIRHLRKFPPSQPRDLLEAVAKFILERHA